MKTSDRIRIVFVDDNEDQILLYKELVEEFFADELEIIAAFSRPLDAIKKLPGLNPDILFLDVEMPQIDGFELLQLISPYSFKVVMITGHESFAFPALKANVFDYLVKPVSVKALKETIIKYLSSIKAGAGAAKKDAPADAAQEEKLIINSHESLYIIPVKDIVRLEAKGAYTEIFYDNIKVVSSKAISYYEQQLTKNFYRAHRSHLININHIKAIEKEEDGDGVVVMTDNSRVALSKLKKNELIRIIAG